MKLEDIEHWLKALRTDPNRAAQADNLLSTWTDSVAQLETQFKALLNAFASDLAERHGTLEADNIRFVIIIDDLDRCLPDTTIALLESIKNYLTVERCIFVLGLNARVVYQGISHKYRGLNIDGREYLEKILNYTFYMPEPKLNVICQYAQDRINALVAPEDRARYQQYFTTFGRVLDECQFNNPRKIKRILNRFLLFIADNERKTTPTPNPLREFGLADYPIENIIRLITIAEYFPALFQLLIIDSDRTNAAVERMKFSGPGFSITKFEEHFSMSISDIYPQLARMSKLFVLQAQNSQNTPDLREQALAVYRITRLI